MNTQTEKPKLTVNFRHRLSILGNELDARIVSDTVNCMINRAEATLEAIANQFVDDSDKLSDSVMYFLCESVKNELKDIRETVDALHQAQRSTAPDIQ